MMFILGLERINHALMRGDEFDAKDMQSMRNRCAAFVELYDNRIKLIKDMKNGT
jgi:hypothetical protein